MDNKYEAQYIALKTLKQRCEYLQQKLDKVEEENCKLKLESREYNRKSNTTVDNGFLEKQIVLLNHQKMQLSQQIQMITNENQTLWSHLSKLMPGNDNLGNKLSVSTIQFNQGNMELGEFGNSINLDGSNNVMGDCSKESLEEISLKLINGILLGKTELENQYSEMIDLQKDSSVSNKKNISCFSIQQDNRAAINSMKGYIQKLKDFKQLLQQQKSELSSVITNMKNFKSISSNTSNSFNNGDCSKLGSMKFFNRENISSGENRMVQAGNREENSEMICPMCGEGFQGSFTVFYQHVSEHFEDDNEEYVDASATFEVIP